VPQGIELLPFRENCCVLGSNGDPDQPSGTDRRQANRPNPATLLDCQRPKEGPGRLEAGGPAQPHGAVATAEAAAASQPGYAARHTLQKRWWARPQKPRLSSSWNAYHPAWCAPGCQDLKNSLPVDACGVLVDLLIALQLLPVQFHFPAHHAFPGKQPEDREDPPLKEASPVMSSKNVPCTAVSTDHEYSPALQRPPARRHAGPPHRELHDSNREKAFQRLGLPPNLPLPDRPQKR
jgi:hypothetical protein